jgi:glucose dehydrogenase
VSRVVANRRTSRNLVLHHVTEVVGPIALSAAIGGVWLMSLGGSMQFLMAASALAAASQLLFFLNSDEPPVAKRAALAYRIVAS